MDPPTLDTLLKWIRGTWTQPDPDVLVFEATATGEQGVIAAVDDELRYREQDSHQWYTVTDEEELYHLLQQQGQPAVQSLSATPLTRLHFTPSPTPPMTMDEPTPEEYDDRLSRLTETIEELRKMLERDYSLPTDQRMFARRLLFLASQPITEATRMLPEPDQDATSTEDHTPESGDDYAAAVTHIERQLCWLIRSLQTGQPPAHHYDEPPAEKLTTALEYATGL